MPYNNILSLIQVQMFRMFGEGPECGFSVFMWRFWQWGNEPGSILVPDECQCQWCHGLEVVVAETQELLTERVQEVLVCPIWLYLVHSLDYPGSQKFDSALYTRK